MTCERMYCGPGRLCRRCRLAATVANAPADIEWFRRTGHCGGCGQPGGWCLCTEAHPCGCRDRHAMGSGVGRDAADVFTDPAVGADQGELFG